MSPSTRAARSVVAVLVAAGVRELVVCPGSRNAPLSFAAYDAAHAGLLRLHTRLDERSAGFLALGLAKVGPPAAVVCTSGTAVANLHPAVLEAAHAGVTLVAVTADRPARLRGTGANQTTDQVGIFGPLVPTVDVAEQVVRSRSGRGRCTSTCTSTSRWCPMTGGRRTRHWRPARATGIRRMGRNGGPRGRDLHVWTQTA